MKQTNGADSMDTYLKPTPWDKRNFHINTYELTSASEEALQETNQIEGHFTLKIDPTINTEKLYKYGFYYTDTLIEPVCQKSKLKLFKQDGMELSRDYDKAHILEIAGEVFTNGRFHRDFNIPNFMADHRYKNWVNDLIQADKIVALIYGNHLAGFFAYDSNKVLLLAMDKSYRGRGLAKSFTSHCVDELFRIGNYEEVRTSISPSNPASLNVFISLGFRLNGTVDVYHKLNGSLPVGV